jgi:hypothetical protein
MKVSKRMGLYFSKIFTAEGFVKSRGRRSTILLFVIFLCIAGGYYFFYVLQEGIT